MGGNIINYYVNDLINTLENVKNNPYGIKDTYHSLERAQKRGVDLNEVNSCIYNGLIVGVEKSLNESNIFQILYEYNNNDDLCIVINILNDEEIAIITLIYKDVKKRRHYEH